VKPSLGSIKKSRLGLLPSLQEAMVKGWLCKDDHKLNVNVLSGLDFPRSGGKDCHSHGAVLSCNQSSGAATMEGDVSI